MSKAKAKPASKNNPTSGEQANEYFHNGQKIKPVKLIAAQNYFLAAEYESSDLVVGSNGQPLPYGPVQSLS